MSDSTLLEKSNMTMKTGTMLAASKDSDYWISSIHCSYYSLLQIMLYLLVEVRNPPLAMEDLINKGDTHMRTRDAIILEIGSRTERVSFMTGFDMLKRSRVRADYTPELFTQEKCLDLKVKAESLRNKAESYFRKRK